MKHIRTIIMAPADIFLWKLLEYLTYMVLRQIRVMMAKELERNLVVASIMSPEAKSLLEIRNMMPMRSEKAATIARTIHLRNTGEGALASLLLPCRI
jgi:hypothetical protein